MPEYTHTLIPDRSDFVPEPKQVASFFEGLIELGAAPTNGQIRGVRLSGESRSFLNPFTKAMDSFPIWKPMEVDGLAAITMAVEELNDYNLILEGEGPPKVPALLFSNEGRYGFAVHCCLRREVVSTSNWHEESPIKRSVTLFGQRCTLENRLGIFSHPDTLAIIEVPNAGCARFWIEFEFGKMLFPEIDDRLDLMEPSIVRFAEDRFRIKFAQGCCWCA
jgi:hypothetical protein